MNSKLRIRDLVDKGMIVYGEDNLIIENLTHKSYEKGKNVMFFAIDGTNINGENFALEAVKNGAVCVVSSHRLDLPVEVSQIVCEDVRKAMSTIAGKFYDTVNKRMFIISVTGTNGKTTSTYMLANVFKAAGKKVGIIGTNGIFIDEQKIGQNLTTPDPIDLHKTLAKFSKNGVEVVCMEMSAHALELQKNWGIMTDIALFTNLTQDHLDFFEDMEKYGQAKAKLFTQNACRLAVVNADDDFGYELFKTCKIPVIAYARERNKNYDRMANCNIIAYDELCDKEGNGQDFTVKVFGKEAKIHLNIDGGFNVANALGVIGAGHLAGLSLKTIAAGLSRLKKVDGRFNTYLVNGVKVVVDYAHTPDGIMNILCAARELAGGHKVISVFGCGGNRDSTKREVMGRISCENADFTFITSDNPRYEDPYEIAKQIEQGFDDYNYKIVVDRTQAIKQAVMLAKPGDIVVVAGKGAENYMDIRGQKIFFSDKVVIEELKQDLDSHTNR